MSGCRRARRRILRESDERLAADEAFALAEHLERCAPCRRFRALELEVRQALAGAAEPAAPPAALERTVAAARALARPGSGRPSAPRRLAVGLAAAALVALLGASAWRASLARRAAPAGTTARSEEGASPADAASGRAPRGSRAGELAAAGTPADAPARDGASQTVAMQPPEDSPAPDAPFASSAASAADSALATVAALPPAAPGAPRTPEELRARLRESLREAFAEDAAEGPRRFAREALALEAAWPLDRFLEELVRDRDDALASAAARVLAARGERLAVPALRGALERPGVAPAALAALAGLGPAGLEEVERALADPTLEDAALAALVRAGGAPAAGVLGRALARPLADREREERRLEALVALGRPALAPLLRLAAAGGARAPRFVAALPRLANAAGALVPLLEADPFPPELACEACLALPSLPALEWLRERALDLPWREPALAALARWEGVEALEAALALSGSGRLAGERVEALVLALVARDPGRARAFAAALAREGARGAGRAGALLELLLAAAAPGSGAACAELTRAALPEDQRLLAALAAGELGEPADVPLCLELLARAGPRERRLRAALLLSIDALGGAPAVARALGDAPRGADRERLLEALAEAGRRGAAVSVHRVARALDALAPRSPDPWRSS